MPADTPQAVQDVVRGTPGNARADLEFVERQIARYSPSPRNRDPFR
jgi:hypothetical protein